jgi:hypothetical protein
MFMILGIVLRAGLAGVCSTCQIFMPVVAAAPESRASQPRVEWAQQAGNAQRTGYTPEEPTQSDQWKFAWHWKPASLNLPRQAQAVVGGGLLFMPAGKEGLYAINIHNGSVAWRNQSTEFEAAGVYDANTKNLFIGGKDGKIYRFDATGRVVSTFQTPNGGQIDKALLLAGGHLYAADTKSFLYKLSTPAMTLTWTYDAQDVIETPPSYSQSRDIIIVGTRNLKVHGVRNADGKAKWAARKVTELPSIYEDPCSAHTFNYGWPVVADAAGVVFMRIRSGHENDYLFANGEQMKYPTSNAAIKDFLDRNPKAESVFAVNLDTGANAFTPATGSGGIDGDVFPCKLGPFDKTIGPMPVVKTFADGSQRGYSVFRNGQTQDPAWDNRWDGHIGEMNLVDNPATSYDERGDMKFIRFNTSSLTNGLIVDEMSPLTMAGNMIFYSHWGAVTSAFIPRTYSQSGNTLADEIPAIQQRVVMRRLNARPGLERNNATRVYNEWGQLFCDTRSWNGSGFWVFFNEMDGGDQACMGDYYGDGMRPRYTFVSSGYIFFIGNGGDVFALKY